MDSNTRTFKQVYLDYPNEKGWWWYCDGQSLTAMYVDPEKGVIREMVGTAKNDLPISRLSGHWQKMIGPGNATITIVDPE